MDGTWAPPVTDGSGRDRETLKRALDLLDAAGFELVKTVLRDKQTKTAVRVRIPRHHQGAGAARDRLRAPPQARRHHLRVRVVDAVQYDRRRIAYDFDMIEYRWDQSLSPGNEQAFYWGSAAADEQGTRNYMGVKSPAIDAMIAALLKARERGEFVSAVRALDRLLISGFYVVPLFHLPEQWVARWTTIAHPETISLFGYLPETWWRRAMILGDPQTRRMSRQASAATLDDLFRNAAARRPDAIALCDPPNRSSFTDGEPRRLTYAQADHIVSAIAGRLRRLGLSTDVVVALQLPNTVESVLALLGVLRAGLIAAPLPLLWRRADAAAALNRVGAKAIITSCADRRDRSLRVSPWTSRPRFFRSATSAASATNLPDGVIPLDDLMAAAPAARSACPGSNATAIPPLMRPSLPSKSPPTG